MALVDDSSFVKHYETHSKGSDYQCDKAFSVERYLIPTKSHTEETLYQCNSSDEALTQNNNLISQIITDSDDEPYQCNQYNKVFTQNSKVLSLLNTSNADKLDQCNQCYKSSSDKSDFTKHLKSHQSKYYLYHCIHCDKAFTHKGSLIRHQKIHNGEKSYQYSQCDKAFAKNMGL